MSPAPRDAHLVRICPLTGMRATDACDRALGEWFRPGDEPLDPCSASASGPGRIRPAAAGRCPVSIRSPEDGLRVLRDPETPPEQSTLALRALASPPVPQLLWYVDGAPYRVADYPYTVRWRLAAGEHVFQARLIDGRTASRAVHVLVQ